MNYTKQTGFTLVELMIATVVFSVILLVLTAGVMQIGRTYYKGLINTRTQEAVRSAVDDIAQAVQFSGGTIIEAGTDMDNGTAHGICVHNRRYSYVQSQQLRAGGPRRFVADTVAGGCDSATVAMSSTQLANPTANPGQELLGQGMRIVYLEFRQDSADASLYDITLRVAYGDDNVLCSPSISGDCANTTGTSTALNNDDLMCKSNRATSQFCAVAEISTTVNKRIR